MDRPRRVTKQVFDRSGGRCLCESPRMVGCRLDPQPHHLKARALSVGPERAEGSKQVNFTHCSRDEQFCRRSKDFGSDRIYNNLVISNLQNCKKCTLKIPFVPHGGGGALVAYHDKLLRNPQASDGRPQSPFNVRATASRAKSRPEHLLEGGLGTHFRTAFHVVRKPW